ncbi:hypothetical protein NFI96_007636 [Prochilodus magdalenae]|nr:hypothetical protein NFI96_007636 [Prochilodus magdalenae]
MNATMNAKQMWLCIFLVLCSIPSLCYGCGYFAKGYDRVSHRSLSILREMEGDTVPITRPFPERLYEEIEESTVGDKVSFLADVTGQIVKLLNDTEKWDTRELQHILNKRHLEAIKRCAEAYPSTRTRQRKIRRHFRKLKNILKKDNYSEDSWVRIRAIVKTHLLRMDLIAGHLRRKFRG